MVIWHKLFPVSFPTYPENVIKPVNEISLMVLKETFQKENRLMKIKKILDSVGDKQHVLLLCCWQTDRQAGRQADRQTGRQADRQTKK